MEDASPEEILLDLVNDNSDEELNHDDADILFYMFFCVILKLFFQLFSDVLSVSMQFRIRILSVKFVIRALARISTPLKIGKMK